MDEEAETMKPLLFLGSRRSGTVVMNRIVNRHPKMYASFERYVIWLLYQCATEHNTKFESYFGDSRRMDETLKNAAGIFKRLVRDGITRETLRAAFFEASLKNMWARPDGAHKAVEWIGEKNPETADDPLWDFADWILPDARYIHMVRHPVAVALSKQRFVEERYDFDKRWHAPVEMQVEEWLRVEQRVQHIISKGAQVITVRLEDVWEDPGREFDRVFSFFGVGPSDCWRVDEKWVERSGHDYDTDVEIDMDGLGKMMERYGYE